jgi:hypothetical protein
MVALLHHITYEGKHYECVTDVSARKEMEKLAKKLKPLEQKIIGLGLKNISVFKQDNNYIMLFPEALRDEIIQLLSQA